MIDKIDKLIFFSGQSQAETSNGVQWTAIKIAVILSPARLMSVIGLFKNNHKSDNREYRQSIARP